MTVFDIILLVIAVVLTLLGFLNGFCKMLLRAGATVAATILAGLFGGMLGRTLIPDLISGDGALGSRMSSETLERVNHTLSSALGMLAIFLIALLILRLVARIISKKATKGFFTKTVDRLLGLALGLVVSVGAAWTFAFLVGLAGSVEALITGGSSLLDAAHESVIFKYFM